MKRILLVDGNADSRTIYRTILRHRGYEVLEAEHGEAALMVLGGRPVDAVITELTLSPVDGFELLSRVRSSETLRDLCVIVLTARALPEDRARAERAGCTLFLPKPLEPQQLVRHVQVLL